MGILYQGENIIVTEMLPSLSETLRSLEPAGRSRALIRMALSCRATSNALYETSYSTSFSLRLLFGNEDHVSCILHLHLHTHTHSQHCDCSKSAKRSTLLHV